MRQAARHHSSVTEELEVIAPSKLAIEGVSKSFRSASGTVLALDRVSLKVAEGEFACLVGASGCGKTTLPNIIAGLEKPDSGTVLADGKAATGPGRARPVRSQAPARSPTLDVLGSGLLGTTLTPKQQNKRFCNAEWSRGRMSGRSGSAFFASSRSHPGGIHCEPAETA